MSLEINKETQLCISIAARPGNFGATVHNAAFKSSGLNYCYIPIGVQNVEDAITGLRAFKIKGCGVSMPYKEKVISFYAKEARGAMCNYIIKNKISQYQDLKKFSGLNYVYSKNHSTEHNLVFTRNHN